MKAGGLTAIILSAGAVAHNVWQPHRKNKKEGEKAMTIKELKTATAGLGFEDNLDSSSRFYSAANRALYAANRIRPKEKTYKLEHNPIGELKPEIYIGSEGYSSYPIKFEDFLCFAPSPVSRDGKNLIFGQDYFIEDGTEEREKILFLKTDARGDYRILYYRRLTPISDENENAKIDLDEDICQILPLLIASYVWLDDEEEKSAIYRNLFYSEASQIKDFGGNGESKGSKYHLDGGWDS